jgi:Raf kinase inhibitor-like YbhB/YbcL family protein
MRTSVSLLLVVPAFLLAAGMATARQGGGAPQTPPPPPLTMTSTGFTDGAMLPLQYTCSAKPAAVTPPLAWINVPNGTVSFALITHDMEPRPRKGVDDNLHWMIWNIPGTATSLPEGVPAATAELPDGSRQSRGGANGAPGYAGPCPPQNVALVHHYAFELFAATASGSGASGGSWDRSCSQAKNRMNGTPRAAVMTADGPAQHRVAGLQRVQHRPLGHRAGDVEVHLAVDAGEGPQVRGEHDPDHGSVWTSTDRTAGRSRTIGAQLSPESAEA